ncbi:MAG: hypothetical protein QXL96_01350 [Ignisphaera sp.]
MNVKVIKIDPRLNLFMLFYPSFILPMFNIQEDKAIKLWGECRGLVIIKEDSKLVIKHSDRVCLDYADEILGFWSIPSRFDVIEKRYREFLEILVSEYSWFGIATSPLDDVEIFSSIFLSQNTDFHVNVVKWVRNIMEKYGSIEALTSLELADIVKCIGGSYQVLNLVHALKQYLMYRDHLLKKNPEEVITYMLKIKGVGPKVSHAYLVFVRKLTIYAPIDRNLISFLRNFDVTFDLIANAPKKGYCIRYPCGTCPINIGCTYYRVRNAFKVFAAWVQTVAYIHSKLMCKPKLCHRCFLNKICMVYTST